MTAQATYKHQIAIEEFQEQFCNIRASFAFFRGIILAPKSNEAFEERERMRRVILHSFTASIKTMLNLYDNKEQIEVLREIRYRLKNYVENDCKGFKSDIEIFATTNKDFLLSIFENEPTHESTIAAIEDIQYGTQFHVWELEAMIRERLAGRRVIKEIELIQDISGTTIGFILDGKFQWQCSKADIGKICAYMLNNNLINFSEKELANKAIQFLPESSKFKSEKGKTEQQTMEEAMHQAIKNAKREERQSSRFDLKSSADAVLLSW